jgi:hypothetical protein
MPQQAWTKKREREYEKLKGEFEQEGRYRGREEEVAARIVNKQRAQYGETKEAKRKDREGKSPDQNLPLDDYDRLTVDDIVRELDDLSDGEVRRIRDYEKEHKERKSLLQAIERRLEG